MARWTVSRMTDPSAVSDGDLDDPTWYPIQHALGIDTFGINLFAATRSEQTLVEEHDESESGQQELYLVLADEAVLALDGEEVRADPGTAVAVTEPTVRRSAKALTAGTMLLIVGAGRSGFVSTWNQSHFHDIPRRQ